MSKWETQTTTTTTTVTTCTIEKILSCMPSGGPKPRYKGIILNINFLGGEA